MKQRTESGDEKEIENISELVCDGESEVPLKPPSGGSVLPENKAGALQGFLLEENVKYSLKEFEKANNHKEPDMTPPGRANTKCSTSYSRAPTFPCLNMGLCGVITCQLLQSTKEWMLRVDMDLFRAVENNFYNIQTQCSPGTKGMRIFILR